MHIIWKVMIGVLLIVGSVSAEESEAKKLCDAEVQKAQPNMQVVEKECLVVAEQYRDQKNFNKASWYYLLGNKYANNFIFEKNINKNYAYANMAHSYVLEGRYDNAEVYYEKYLLELKNDTRLNDYIEKDYKLLNKLYPKEKLKVGIGIWKKVLYKYFPSLKAKTICDSEVRKEKPDKDIVKKSCSEVAVNLLLLERYKDASWYLILANYAKYNIDWLQYQDEEVKKSINVAHSYLILGDEKRANEYYQKYFDRGYRLADVKDFKILSHLYPNVATDISIAEKSYKQALHLNKEKMKQYSQLKKIRNKCFEQMKTQKDFQAICTEYYKSISSKEASKTRKLLWWAIVNHKDKDVGKRFEVFFHETKKPILRLLNFNSLITKVYPVPKELRDKIKQVIFKSYLSSTVPSALECIETKDQKLCNQVAEEYYHREGLNNDIAYWFYALADNKLMMNFIKARYHNNLIRKSVYDFFTLFNDDLASYHGGIELLDKDIPSFQGDACLYIAQKEHNTTLRKNTCFKLANYYTNKGEGFYDEAMLDAWTANVDENMLNQYVDRYITNKWLPKIEKELSEIGTVKVQLHNKLDLKNIILKKVSYPLELLKKTQKAYNKDDLNNTIGLMEEFISVVEKRNLQNEILITQYKDNLAEYYYENKDYDKAIEQYKKVIETYQKHHKTYMMNDAIKALANCYIEKKQYDKAEQLIEKYYADIEKLDSDALKTALYIYFDLPRTEERKSKVFKYNDAYFKLNAQNIFMSNDDKMGMYVMKAIKNIDNPIKMYLFSKKGFEVYVKNLDKELMDLSASQKQAYLKKNIGVVRLFLGSGSWIIQNKKDIKVHNVVLGELLKAWLNYKGAIFDSENTISILYANTKDKVLKEKIEALINAKRTLAKLYQSLPKPKERKQWQEKIKQTESTIDTLTKEIASKAEKFKEEQGLKNISYQDISSHLKKDELYIDFAKAGDYYYVFTLDSKANITFKQIDEKSTKRIDSLVKHFREDVDVILNDANLTDEKLKELTMASKEKLSRLYSLITKPIQEELKSKKNLIISPDGALKLLPFEALYNKTDGQYLIEQKDIRYVPSGKELVRLYKYGHTQQPTQTSSEKTVIFDNPNFNAKTTKSKQKEREEEVAITPNTSRAGIVKSLFKMRFNPLPGTKAEAQSIKQTLQDNVTIEEYKEAKATEANLLKVKQPNILHIATHGFFINDNTIPNPMLKSGIALSGANSGAKLGTGEGIVTALKLSGLQLKGTDLVVLSACQTGVVDINSTDSVSGLSKAFIQAGAKDIVMSLWSVNDQATKELMSSFYKKVKTEPNYAKALKEAKLNLIKQNMHPFFWAPFVVSGL